MGEKLDGVELGFIGYGSIGSMLVRGFISSGDILESNMIISTRNKNVLKSIKDIWPNIIIAQDNTDVIKKAKHIFLCVKPHQVKDVLKEIKDSINNQTHIISTNSFVTIDNIEKTTNAKVTKVSPSLASEVGEGISLICHGHSVGIEDKTFVENLLNRISKVITIEESDFVIADKFTSCGPGFIATILDEFIQNGLADNCSITREMAELLVLQTILGTAKLFTERNMKINDMISRVATEGGITEEGINVLKDLLPSVFNIMFERSVGKSKQISESVNSEFFY